MVTPPARREGRVAKGAAILIAALALASLAPRLQQRGEPKLFPFQKGEVWVYEGVFFNSDEHSVSKKTVRWEMRALDVKAVGDMEVALVTGFPPAHDPEGKDPRKDRVLIVRDARGRYFLVTPEPDTDRWFESIPAEEEIRGSLSDDGLVWVPGLKVGGIFAQGPDYERDDGFYCWRVLGWRRFDLAAVMESPPERWGRRYVLGYDTGPDRQICDYVPGVGLVRFVYVLHGAVVQDYVRLVRVSRESEAVGAKAP